MPIKELVSSKIAYVVSAAGYIFAQSIDLNLKISNQFADIFIENFVRFGFGILLFVITYFIKKWLDARH